MEFNMNGEIIRTSRQFCKVTKYSPEELLNVRFHEFFHPDDITKSLEALSNVTKGNIQTNFENRIISKDGKVEWF
jgi:PAS domain S-box-containing protein